MLTPQHFAPPVRESGDRSDGVRIKVVGIGGAGGNAINRMIAFGLEGIEFIALNTDIQALQTSRAEVRCQIGAGLSHGRGTGSDPDVGRHAALDDSDKILEALSGADMVFVIAGLGGGTGTGAAPVVAALARETGALTVAIVTRPFAFEGKRRMAIADWGMDQLLDCVDTLLVIPNERLLAVAKDVPFFESFRIGDDFILQAVQGISDIITTPGVINRDFADLKVTMTDMGYAVMGAGCRTGPTRAVDAVMDAVASPLLEAGAVDGARGILINITGSSSLRLSEVNEASGVIQRIAHEDANILFGAVLDERLGDAVKVTVIATGFRGEERGGSLRRARLTREAETNAPGMLAAETLTQSIAFRKTEGLEDGPDTAAKDRQAVPDEEPTSPVPAFADEAESDDWAQQESRDRMAPSEVEGEEDWKDAVRELARLTEAGPDFEANDCATLSGGLNGPFEVSETPESTTDRLVLDDALLPQPVLSPRQAALAAYSTFRDEEPEARRDAPRTAFAEILEARRRFSDSLAEESPSRYSPVESETRLPAAPPTPPTLPFVAVLRAPRDFDVDTSPNLSVRALVPDVVSPHRTAEIEELPKPLPDFNRRLHRDPAATANWKMSEMSAERRVRVPSFASAAEEEPNDDLDELDIPAFLRRGN